MDSECSGRFSGLNGDILRKIWNDSEVRNDDKRLNSTGLAQKSSSIIVDILRLARTLTLTVASIFVFKPIFGVPPGFLDFYRWSDTCWLFWWGGDKLNLLKLLDHLQLSLLEKSLQFVEGKDSLIRSSWFSIPDIPFFYSIHLISTVCIRHLRWFSKLSVYLI